MHARINHVLSARATCAARTALFYCTDALYDQAHTALMRLITATIFV
jgi:hypothetical protein